MTKRPLRIQFLFASLVLLTTYASPLKAQSLNVRLEADQLKISAPQLRFLTGEAMQRLRDGATVPYVFELYATGGRYGARLAHAAYRFVVSYDLWEEKFAVTRINGSLRSVSHLSSSAAERWCLDSLTLPANGLNPNESLTVTLDYRAEESSRPETADNSGFTLGGLIDIFSRRNQKQPLRGSRQSGPFRLSDLRKK